jgi:hypothetical protein
MTTWISPRPRLFSLHLWVFRHRVAILSSLGALLLVCLAGVAYFTSVVVTRFDGRRWNLPSRIYSDLQVLHEGDSATPERLVEKLGRFHSANPARRRSPGARAQGSTVCSGLWHGIGRVFRGFLACGFPAERFDRDGFGDPVAALVLERRGWARCLAGQMRIGRRSARGASSVANRCGQ